METVIYDYDNLYIHIESSGSVNHDIGKRVWNYAETNGYLDTKYTSYIQTLLLKW